MRNLPCAEALDTTHDLGIATHLFQPPRRIGHALLMLSLLYEDDGMKRGIGLAVAPAIEAMTVGLDRTSGQGVDATERSKRRI